MDTRRDAGGPYQLPPEPVFTIRPTPGIAIHTSNAGSSTRRVALGLAHRYRCECTETSTDKLCAQLRRNLS